MGNGFLKHYDKWGLIAQSKVLRNIIEQCFGYEIRLEDYQQKAEKRKYMTRLRERDGSFTKARARLIHPDGRHVPIWMKEQNSCEFF